MNRFGLFLGMLILVLASGSGCGLRRCLVPCCGDCGRGNVGLASCGGGSCGGNCGSSCGVANDPILGDYTRCGVCGGGNCPGFTPLAWLKYRLTCGSGCACQLYYGEWINDPPACCDPCDNCGNYTGPNCAGRGRPVGPLLREMWGGYPYNGACCSSGNSMGGYPGHGPMMGTGPRMEDGPRKPASDEVDGAPENVKPGKTTSPESPQPNSLEPKASRPTPAKRASYQQPGVPTRPGSYRGNPQYQQYPPNSQYQQYPQNQQYPR